MIALSPLTRALLVGAGIALVAGGCASDGDGTVAQGERTTLTETTTVYMDGRPPVPSTEVEQPSPPAQSGGLPEASVGEPFSVVCHHSRPCAATMTITRLTVGEPCEFGVNTYFGTEFQETLKKKPGESYLQIHAEFDLSSAPGGWMTIDEPEVVNAEGFTQTPGPNVECLDSTADEGNWNTTIDNGQKKRLYATWVIPDGATAINLEDHQIALPS